MSQHNRGLKRAATGFLAGVAVASLILSSTSARTDHKSAHSVRVNLHPRATTLSADDFTVSTLGWDKSAESGAAPILSVEPGQDERLLSCGSDAWANSMLVLSSKGVAYCIEGFDASDPQSIASARILAMKLQGNSYDAAELNVLRLQTLLGYAAPESPEAAAYRDQLDLAWESLTPDEQRHLLG